MNSRLYKYELKPFFSCGKIGEDLYLYNEESNVIIDNNVNMQSNKPDFIEVGKGYFEVEGWGEWVPQSESMIYYSTNDSATKHKEINNDPNRKVVGVVNKPYRIYKQK